MLNRTKILGTACILAMGIAATPVSAGAPMPFAGTVGGGYTYSSADCSGCSGHSDNWGFSGQGAFGLGANDLAAEIDAGYTNSSFSGGGGSVDTWGAGGALFWSPDMGRLGISGSWARVSVSGFHADAYTYGGFGEFFASDFFTVGGGLGGATVDLGSGLGSVSAFTLNGGATGYPMPNLAITGAVTYANFNQGIGGVTALSIGAEWLISEDVPVSIGGGYTRVMTPSGLPDSNAFSVVAKFYFGGPPMSLIGHHRNGSLDSLATVNTVVLQTVF
jgi:hypothetical protein